MNLVPHSQFEGARLKGQPHLRAIASRNAPLCSLKPKSAIGKVVSQLEAPLSEARSIDLFSTSGKSLFSLSMACVACCISSEVSHGFGTAKPPSLAGREKK